MASEFPLSLVIKAVDKVTAPLREINGKIKSFTAPVRKLNNSLKALSDESGMPRLLKGFQGVGQAVGSVGKEAMSLGLQLAGMATAASLGLYAIVRGAMEAGDKLGMMAERVGLSVDTYAQLQFAAAQADVEQEAFNSAMDQFNKRLGEMKAGGGPLLDFLTKVNPAFAEAMKGTQNTEEAFALMTDGFERVTDPAKRAALAAAVFGKSGLQMGQFLGQGSKAIAEQRARYLELAGSQEEFTKGSDALDQATRETEVAFFGLRSAAAGALFPALTELAKAVTGVLTGNRQGLAAWAKEAGAAISEWVKGGGVQRVVDTMKSWGETIAGIVDRLGGLKGVLMLVGLYLASGFIGAVAGAVSALWQLGAAAGPVLLRGFMLLWPAITAASSAVWGFTAALLANPITWIVAGVVALAGAAYLVWKYWEPIKKLFSDIWGTIKEIVAAPLDALQVAKDYWFGPSDVGRPNLGASHAMPGAGGARTTEARVSVDFNNLPKGARVTQDPGGTAPLDLSMGYSMVGQ